MRRVVLALACAAACVAGTAGAAENWKQLRTTPDGGTMEIDLGNMKPQRYLGLSDYVASKMPTHWSTVIRYTWPNGQVIDGKKVTKGYINFLWICENPIKVSQWGLWATDADGKEVIDMRKDFEMDDLPNFTNAEGDAAETGKLVCAAAKK